MANENQFRDPTKMIRLIDANALKAELENELYMTDSTKAAFRSIIHKTPTVDAVEVVRCKDCKHRFDGLCAMESVGGYPWNDTKDDDFCSYGERKTE